MDYNEENNWVYIHIPRTGGTSMSTIINKHSRSIAPEHAYASQCSQYVRDDAFVFAFIRNPWDWEWSKFCHAVQKPTCHTPPGCTFMDHLVWRMKHRELQSDFITIDGKIVCDWLGRFERLHDDWEYVRNRIGLPHGTLPHLRKIKKMPYTEGYTDETREIVREIHAADIERWGYKFGGEG